MKSNTLVRLSSLRKLKRDNFKRSINYKLYTWSINYDCNCAITRPECFRLYSQSCYGFTVYVPAKAYYLYCSNKDSFEKVDQEKE